MRIFQHFCRAGLAAALSALLPALPALAAATDYPADSAWSTFWGAVADEIVGQPGEAALRKTAVFDEAGVRFDYPAVLRVNYDAEQRQWRLWRGDAELSVQRREGHDAEHARTLLETMQDIMHSERGGPAEPISDAPAMDWCGRQVPGLRLRLQFLGDQREYLAYDLALANGESRLLMFEDVLAKGANSAVALALRDTVARSLSCPAG